jgi:hypothetical protein
VAEMVGTFGQKASGIICRNSYTHLHLSF